MPFLKSPPGALCDGGALSCRCARCQASRVLQEEDWEIVGFYRRVSQQYVNQTPMGTKGGGAVCTPRLEGYKAALELYDYPRECWEWMVDNAVSLHNLIHDQDGVDWRQEIPRLRMVPGNIYDKITPEDVT